MGVGEDQPVLGQDDAGADARRQSARAVLEVELAHVDPDDGVEKAVKPPLIEAPARLASGARVRQTAAKIDRRSDWFTMAGFTRWLPGAKTTTFRKLSAAGNLSGNGSARSGPAWTPPGPSTTCSTCSPTRPGRGCTSATRGLHRDRHHRPLQAGAGLQRAAPDGLGRVRPARRAARGEDRDPPRRQHPEQHLQLPAPDKGPGLLLRLGPGDRHDRPPLFQVDAVDLPAALQEGARLCGRAPVWWCPELRTVLANEEVVDGKSEVGGLPRRAPATCASGC